MRISFVAVALALGLFFGMVGCDRVSNPIQDVVMGDDETAVTGATDQSKNWVAYTVGEVVHVNYLPDEYAGFQVVSIGGADTSPIIGVSSPLPNSYFGEGTLIQRRFEEDIVGVDFGATLALYEPNESDTLYVPMVGDSGALLAVGAPKADDGAGAVFIFRIGSQGLWLEAKLTPDNGRTRGFGATVEFLTTSDGVEYLAIQSANQAEAAAYHIESFLGIG